MHGRPIQRILWTSQARLAPYLFLLPFLLLFAGLMVYPLGQSFLLSFQKTAGTRRAVYVGFGNYTYLFRDLLFWLSVANTLFYALLLLPIQMAAALGLAMVLNSSRLWFRNLFRFAFFSTYLVGQVFLAVLASLMLSPRHGVVNQLIGWLLPCVGSELNWRGDTRLAMPGIVLASLWVSLGYAMVYWLAALQAVDRELYEAAEIDGAGRLSRFCHVTLPGIRPVAAFLVLVGTIGALQLFELPYVYFQGPGPGLRGLTIVEYLYANGIQAGDLGFAAAVGWVLVLLILGVTFLQLRLTRALKE